MFEGFRFWSEKPRPKEEEAKRKAEIEAMKKEQHVIPEAKPSRIDPRATRGEYFGGGHRPEDYVEGSSDYPTIHDPNEPFIEPVYKGLNPEEALMAKRGELEEGEHDFLGRSFDSDDVGEEEGEKDEGAGEEEEGADVLPFIPHTEQLFDKKRVQEIHKSVEERKAGSKPRYFRKTKTLPGGVETRVIRGQHPEKMPVGKKKKGAPTIRKEKVA